MMMMVMVMMMFWEELQHRHFVIRKTRKVHSLKRNLSVASRLLITDDTFESSRTYRLSSVNLAWLNDDAYTDGAVDTERATAALQQGGHGSESDAAVSASLPALIDRTNLAGF